MPTDFQDLELVIGYFMGHRFYINDTLLEIDPSEYNGGRQTLKITPGEIMNLPNKLTVIRVLLVPLLILVYMFPYDTTGISVPVYHILDTDISLVNIIILVIFIIASITDYF